MSTKNDLINNPKPIIRRIYKDKTFSINLSRSITDQLKLNTDYMTLYVSNDDKIIFEKVNTGLENKENWTTKLNDKIFSKLNEIEISKFAKK